ncbi:MAG: hypothetical protein KC483_07400 [Nitrosarchaeum sp.]|nr:hypothetical protein [Nitrosarchaeum sp.]MCA9819487.1 hypothetical protein [Nitrosarchaeum sp.]
MQQLHLDNKGKSKILLLVSGVIITGSVPLFMPHFLHGHGFHTGIHIAGIILGSFLSIVGAITYLEYKTTRLLLVLFAFLAVTTAEVLAALNMVFLFWPSYSSIDSVITHLLILMMLTFFSVGIFRRD